MSTIVLVVEDAPEIRLMLTSFLQEEGMVAHGMATGGELRAGLAALRPDIVLLDINLPDADGIALARELRLGEQCGLIFVTSRDSDDDVLSGLEAGGDDYISKPINLRTLLARIRSVLRRTKESVVTFDGWILDPVRRELFRPDGSMVKLTSGEFNILAALASQMTRPLSRDFLLDVISNRDPREISEHTVDNLIVRLRRKMQYDGTAAPIATVRGVGYALIPVQQPART
ncbi:response regulator transcription factor [Bradyrhizobium iriomotense]|uniref:response regulator transcription factor n=1 Tax=Bradyrhizobium iriomotense TaxID=441950 RepID=UPI001B8A5483|nr:response regulator transcription factor [Bradyrhizobium iriomotense]MBR0781425.1 response regulator transcription factor [Bradyrhizobium iriomotense]